MLRGKFGNRGIFNSALAPVCRIDTFSRDSTRRLRGIFGGETPNCTCSQVNGPAMASFRGEVTSVRGNINTITYSSNVTTIAVTLLGVLRSNSRMVTDTNLFNKAVSLFKSLRPFKVIAQCIGGIATRRVRPLVGRGAGTIFTRLVNGPKLRVTSLSTMSRLIRSRNIPLVVSDAATAPCLVRPFRRNTSVIIRSSSGCVGNNKGSVDKVVISDNGFR